MFLFYYIYEQKNLILIQLFLKEAIFTLLLFPFLFILIKKLFESQNIEHGL